MSIETHNLHTNRTGPSGLYFVLVPEEIDSGFTSTIVKTSFDQNAQHGTLARVD